MKAVLFWLVAACIGMTIAELKSAEDSRWWYAPSQKAPLYEHKYQGIGDKLARAAARQGEDMRLPRDVLPSSYIIQLLPLFEEGNFTTQGCIEILVECKNATKNISMNAADLKINSTSIIVRNLNGKG